MVVNNKEICGAGGSGEVDAGVEPVTETLLSFNFAQISNLKQIT